MDLNLKGKIALVTGSTAGIGLEIARALAQEGAEVTITGRNPEKLEAARQSLEASSGMRVGKILTDAATAPGAARIAEAIPQVDILINNLGIYESKPFTDISDADWMQMFDVNVMSGVRLARSYFPGMLARNWGRVVFISSEVALAVPGDMIHYAVSKTAQLSVTRGLAQLTRGTNVTVNAVLPGPTRSEGIVAFLRSVAPDPTASDSEIEAAFFATGRPSSLVQRMVEAEEVANLVAYLASPRSSATNGAALRAEGGIVNTIA